MPYYISLSLSDLLHSAWQFLDPFMFLQMAWFHSFLWLGNIPYFFFIQSSVDRHLGYFHVLASVNSAAMYMGVHAFFQIKLFSRYMTKTGIAGLYGCSFICTDLVIMSATKSGLRGQSGNLIIVKSQKEAWHPLLSNQNPHLGKICFHLFGLSPTLLFRISIFTYPCVIYN